MLLRCSLLTLLIAPAVAQDVWTVAPNGVNAQFALIQDAVDVAADGDTVLLKGPGAFPSSLVVIDGKGLLLVVDEPAAPQPLLDLEVRNLAPSQWVAVIGTRGGHVLIEDCLGLVHLEGLGQSNGVNGSCTIRDCRAVTLVNSSFDGEFTGNGGDGGDAITVFDSDATLYGCTARGGPGGDQPLCFGLPGNGGDGLRLESGARVQYARCDFIAGTGGASCSTLGSAGLPIQASPGATVEAQTLPDCEVSSPRILREGETGDLVVTGPAGDGAFLLTSTAPQHRVLVPSVGTLHAAVPFTVTPLGTLSGSGTLSLPRVAPTLGPGTDSRIWHEQVFLVGAGVRYLTNPTLLAILDASL